MSRRRGCGARTVGQGWEVGGVLAFAQTPLHPVTSPHKHMEPLGNRQGKCMYLLFHFAPIHSTHSTILYSTAQCDTGHEIQSPFSSK